MGPFTGVLILKGNLKIEIDFFPMVIKLDCGALLDNSFLSDLLSGGLYSWKRGCSAESCVGGLTGGPLGPGSPVFPLRPWERQKERRGRMKQQVDLSMRSVSH